MFVFRHKTNHWSIMNTKEQNEVDSETLSICERWFTLFMEPSCKKFEIKSVSALINLSLPFISKSLQSCLSEKWHIDLESQTFETIWNVFLLAQATSTGSLTLWNGLVLLYFSCHLRHQVSMWSAMWNGKQIGKEEGMHLHSSQVSWLKQMDLLNCIVNFTASTLKSWVWLTTAHLTPFQMVNVEI